MTTTEAYENVLTALCLWREARNQSHDAKRAVYHVIKNRTKDKRWARVMSEVILKPLQFSSFNSGDPNAVLMPHWNDPSWQDCCSVVDEPGEDPTGGANHYYSVPIPKVPKWAEGKTETAQIGAFRFFRL